MSRKLWAKEKTIHKVVASGDAAQLKRLLASKKKAIVNAEDASGATALHIAASLGDVEALKALLVYADINPNAQGPNGKTPLHLAICSGIPDAAQALVEHPRTDVNLADHNGRTPIHHAVDAAAVSTESGGIDMLKILVKTPGINFKAQDKHQRTALRWAVDLGHQNSMTALTSGRGTLSEVSATDAEGGTALHRAVKRRNIGAVAHLAKGQSESVLNAKNKHSETALHRAARLDDSSSIKYLADAGADPGVQRDSDGATLFHIAVQQGFADCVYCLSHLGSSLRRALFVKDNDGNLPLHMAAERGDSEMVLRILHLTNQTYGWEPGIVVTGHKMAPELNNKGEAAIELATRQGHVDIAIQLLQTETIESEEVRSKRQKTISDILTMISEPVKDATYKKRVNKLIQWAVHDGLPKFIQLLRQHDLARALECEIVLAAEKGHLDMVQSLIEQGVNPNAWIEPLGTPAS